jgi:hypothetical protein
MRRFLLVGIVFILGLTCGLAGAARSVNAQSYGPDVTLTGDAISGGDNGCGAGHPASQAFDDNVSTAWCSSQSGAAVNLNAYIGQDFGATSYHIRQIGLAQSATATLDVGSVLVQQSSNGSSWLTVQTITVIKDNSMHLYPVDASQSARYWRLLAGEGLTVGNNWTNVEVQMMEAVSWPTDTPGPSSTPTITLTPSTTPSPTPNYSIEVTSTQGAPMRFERSATMGDLIIFVALILIGGLGLIVFSIWFWQRRPDGS